MDYISFRNYFMDIVSHSLVPTHKPPPNSSLIHTHVQHRHYITHQFFESSPQGPVDRMFDDVERSCRNALLTALRTIYVIPMLQTASRGISINNEGSTAPQIICICYLYEWILLDSVLMIAI